MVNPNPTVVIGGRNKSGKAFREAKQEMRELRKTANRVGISLAAVGVAAAAMVVRTTESTRGNRAFAASLDVSIENMSRWQFAADRVGLEGDKVGDIMKDTADKIGDAWRNNAGEAKEAIESLGLDLERLAQLSPDQQLLILADALDQVETTAEKVQIMESIGNDLSLLLPLLENNAEGLKTMAARSDELGKTLTTIEAEKIEEADAAIMDMKASFDALGQTLTVAVAPGMSAFVRSVGVAVPEAVKIARELIMDLGATAEAFIERWFVPQSDINPKTFADLLVENLRENDRLLEEERQRRAKEDAELGDIDIAGGADRFKAKEAEFEQEMEMTRRFREQQAAVQMDETSRLTEFEMWSAERKTKHIIGESIKMTRGVSQQNRLLFEVNKAAGIANAIVNTHTGITRALAEYPPPLSFVMAGLQAVAGFAEVQAIKSASFGGGGGAGSRSGGGGGPVATPPSDFATAPNLNAPNPAPNITINVEGNVFANDDWRQAMIEQLQVALENDEGAAFGLGV